MAVTISVGGTLRTLEAKSLDVIEGINGRSSLRAGIYSATGAYIPAVDDVVILYEGATIVFMGLITDITVRYLVMGASLVTFIDAADFSHYTERRVIKGETGGGITGRDAVDYIVSQTLAVFGVTRDPGMGTGATLGALSYDYMKVSEALDEIGRIAAPTGWLWRIDDAKVLKAFLPGAAAYACPFGVTAIDSNIVGDIEVKTMRSQYANRVILTYGDGSPTPAIVIANDTAEQTARGIFEVALQLAGPMTAAQALTTATARLKQLSFTPKQVTFVTRETGAHSGQTISIVLPARSLNGDYLINEVQMYDADGKNVFYRIMATEGATPITSWKETYKLWAGMPVARGGVAWGGVTPSTLLFSEDFESGSTLATLGAMNYLGAAASGAANTTANGLNGTTWGMLATAGAPGNYPEVGWDIPAPGYGSRRDGWVQFYCDFSRLQSGGWTFVAPTDGNYAASNRPIFDLYVGTSGANRKFWVYTGQSPGTAIAEATNVFAASTSQLVRVSWRQSTYTGGTPNSDGELRVRINGSEVLSAVAVVIAAGTSYTTTGYEVTRIYTNPCGRLDEITAGYGS